MAEIPSDLPESPRQILINDKQNLFLGISHKSLLAANCVDVVGNLWGFSSLGGHNVMPPPRLSEAAIAQLHTA
ncbi:uncharacterized protein CIMG_11465 [Coccidioides immitis RS]|uniref:Uncharacterized protein n=4 Tax=Coccidioides immitis TaxID=5501 RepID=A0A0D8JUV9_COCIM|nr:uncharacterized protein CIMG_11465 [Coccidioides immitis RS]KJF61092.1 hypothetical protein CIMG_11465 [Coccidioides immitis RS]KMP05247.1 hypothetical protein CIRG_04928 [Coccidioides immitis RMSCC 2394]KMU77777.1 hypothetical protein CISG_01533 [Coccidioides immitis RMSCC 3703]KMU85706.1 hypothetical protein CIHG_03746 [Coccidioides immitis H538.4]